MAGIALWLPEADGITISGGEPFDQPGALLELLQRLREQTSADVLVFSGNSWTDVSSHPALTGFLIDAIVTGRFEINETQTLALRGSDNQELHFITPLGRARFEGYDRKIDPRDRTVDVMFDENGDIWFAGIPARADFRRLQEILESQGTTFRTSEDNRFHSTSKLAP